MMHTVQWATQVGLSIVDCALVGNLNILNTFSPLAYYRLTSSAQIESYICTDVLTTSFFILFLYIHLFELKKCCQKQMPGYTFLSRFGF